MVIRRCIYLDIVYIKLLISSFYNFVGSPLYYFQEDNIKFHFPESAALYNMMEEFRPHLTSLSGEANYHISKNNLIWAILHMPFQKDYLILGPVSVAPLTKQITKNIIQDIENPIYKETLENLLPNLPHYQVEKILSYIKLLYCVFYQKELSINKLFQVSEDIQNLPIGRLHSDATYTGREQESQHDSYTYEMSYLEFIRRGDTQGLSCFFQNAPNIMIGIIADSSLRQSKNIFIAVATTATRAAIEGGLPSLDAYNLSDVYIMQMEKMNNIDQIYQLQYSMLFDFTARTSERIHPGTASSPVFRCTQYISSHVNEPLTVQSVADYIGLSRPYLSKLFSEELGFHMSSFIIRCKLEEAKSLLRYSKKTLGEISSYLCFSSQSYFQNVFKKKYGITPNDFRRLYQ